MGEATQAISAGHGSDLALGWYIIIGLWAVLILTTVALFVDSLLAYRKRRVAQHAEIIGQTREPLLMYTVASGVVIAVWIASLLPLSESYVYTMSIAAAFAAFIAIALIFTYLLRMVFPRVPDDKVADYMAAHSNQVASKMADRHEVTVIGRDGDTTTMDRDGEVPVTAREESTDDHPKGA